MESNDFNQFKSSDGKLLYMMYRQESAAVRAKQAQLQDDLSRMATSQEGLSAQSDLIQQQCSRIEFALLGDDRLKIQGLINKVGEHDIYIQKDSSLKARLSGMAAAIAFFTGIATDFIKDLFNK